MNKDIIIIDLETTGTNVDNDRIVSIGLVTITADGQITNTVEHFVNPGRPIPKCVTDIHGITDEMVKDKPKFEQLAPQIAEAIKGCDVGGFNADKFDIPLLNKEFQRAGIYGFFDGVNIIDAYNIYRKNERRDLSAAVRFYLGREHEGAHSALEDARATAEILIKQIEQYKLPKDNAELHKYCHEKPENWVDAEGKIIMQDGKQTLNFGKFRNKPLEEAATNHDMASYLRWVLSSDFSAELKKIISNYVK
ncbi:MAG: 3'-5' exonuclease [bacterium]